MTPGVITLLGPQRTPTVERVTRSLGLSGTIATINAGWQEREADDAELTELLGGDCHNLKLYQRWAHVQRHDPEFALAVRRRRDTMYELRDGYLARLAGLLEVVAELAPEPTDDAVAEPPPTASAAATLASADPSGYPDRLAARTAMRATARAEALADVRRLDAAHLERIDELNLAFLERWRPNERDVIDAHRSAIMRILDGSVAVAIAGGHVAVLLATAHLFAVRLPVDRPTTRGSAGAMLLTERVVLFHDRTPAGRSDPEVYGRGLGVVRGIVALPHARRRLLLGDRDRMATFAARLAPASGVLLDEGVRIDLAPGGPEPAATPALGPATADPDAPTGWPLPAGTPILGADGRATTEEAEPA